MKAVGDTTHYYGLNDDNLFFNNAQFDAPNGQMKKYDGSPAGSKDWRTDGAVTDIKEQNTCNSSWAFMATDVIASANKIAGGTLYDLSVQQLIDCAEDFGA